MTTDMPSKFLLMAILASALSACMDPQSYESPPVQVTTDSGIVTCQLYTQKRVLWDRSIHRPEKMTVADADAICVKEGKRRAG